MLMNQERDESIVWLQAVQFDEPGGWVPDAQFQMAEVHYKEKNYDEAKEDYEKFLQDFPDHKLAQKAKKKVKKIESKLTPKE